MSVRFCPRETQAYPGTMRLFLTFCVGGLTAAAGCSDPDTLTCDWLAKSDKVLVADLYDRVMVFLNKQMGMAAEKAK